MSGRAHLRTIKGGFDIVLERGRLERIRRNDFLTKEEAAEFCGMTVERFTWLVEDAALPNSFYEEMSRLILWRRDHLEHGLEQYRRKQELLLSCRTSIYVCRFEKWIKIGISVEPPVRLQQIQDGLPGPLSLVHTRKGTKDDEERLHKRFSEYRSRGEWFVYRGRLKKWIEGGCRL